MFRMARFIIISINPPWQKMNAITTFTLRRITKAQVSRSILFSIFFTDTVMTPADGRPLAARM